jgi:LPXTG-site transpeptidase (sortase) family protein
MAEDSEERAGKSRPRRRWLRWVANLLIVAGLLAAPAIYGGTWIYTWFQQKGLEQQLEQASPQVTSVAANPEANDFVPLDIRSESAEESAATEAEAAAAAAAEAERQAQLDAFKTAAAAYQASVAGKTGEPVGRILIPSIGVDVIMVEGTGTGDLKVGPGHWPETPFPGEGGNFVVSGHRTTYGAPFFKLNKVKPGDELDLVLPYAVARYSVTRVVIVLPTEVEAVAQLGKEQVSLAACHPIYSAKQRIVVQGDLVGFKLIGSQS